MKTYLLSILSACLLLSACSSDDDQNPSAGDHTLEVNISGSWLTKTYNITLPNADVGLAYGIDPQTGIRSIIGLVDARDLTADFTIGEENNNAMPLGFTFSGNESFIMLNLKDEGNNGITLIGESGQVTLTGMQYQSVTPFTGVAFGTISFTGLFKDNNDSTKPALTVTGKLVVNRSN